MADRAELPQRAKLIAWQTLLAIWLPTAVITVLHYVTGPELHWFHDVLRRLYYLPILFAAFSYGLRGGLFLAVIVALAYSPHAFTQTHMMHTDPAHTLEKILELLLYLVVGGVAGVLVDRERKRQGELFAALAEQRRMADQLVRAGRLAALGELVAGIAHEIKNPLHALRGTAEVVDPLVPKDSPENRMWQLHLKELDRLGQVADRFLSFARPAPLARKELKLADVVQRAHDLIEAQARQQDVRVSVEPVTFDVASDVASDVAGHVFADEQQLAQVLLNIGINGLQAMEAGGGDLRFSMRQDRRGDQDFAVVCLTNSGPPIPKADIERIFDPFVTSKSDGVGLGLSIANRIVEQHGGFLEAENLSDPTGVRFSVYLPHER